MALRPNDLLFLYTTRNCFHNPIRDRGRVIGEARVASPVLGLAETVCFGAREYPIGCALDLGPMASLGEGVELAPLVHRLTAFPDPASWGMRMRRALVPLGRGDVGLLRRHLARAGLTDLHQAIATYIAAVPRR